MNEAAILAARRNLKEISKEEISDALERIVAGPEKKGAVMPEQKKRLVAYHEVRPSDRALLSLFKQGADCSNSMRGRSVSWGKACRLLHAFPRLLLQISCDKTVCTPAKACSC